MIITEYLFHVKSVLFRKPSKKQIILIINRLMHTQMELLLSQVDHLLHTCQTIIKPTQCHMQRA